MNILRQISDKIRKAIRRSRAKRRKPSSLENAEYNLRRYLDQQIEDNKTQATSGSAQKSRFNDRDKTLYKLHEFVGQSKDLQTQFDSYYLVLDLIEAEMTPVLRRDLNNAMGVFADTGNAEPFRILEAELKPMQTPKPTDATNLLFSN